MNWLSQIFAVSLFSLRAIPERKGSSISAAVGIAGVVLVLVGVLAIAEGFEKAMVSTVPGDVAIVLRNGSDTEMNSTITLEQARVIRDAPGVARNEKGPIVGTELFVIIDMKKRSTGTDANVPLRGVSDASFDVRGNITLVEGRRFEPGKNEIIVGTGAARAFSGLEMGNEMRIGKNVWKVVGIFRAGGGLPESEIWTDAEVLKPAYQRLGYQSVYAKLSSPGSFHEFKDALTLDPQLEQPRVVRLSEFYAEQSSMITAFIKNIGIYIAGLMALGALFGALNTMYGAVSSRTREISTLRALGFGSLPLIISVMVESVALAVAGGALGALAAYLAFDGYQASTINWQTFSQVTFAFAVTPKLLVTAIFWAAVLGLIGGLFPAIRAARLPIAAALRDS